jgi:hypothetical protein
MRRFTVAAIYALGVCALPSCTPPPPAPPPVAPAELTSTDGTVSFSTGAFAVGIGFEWGSGILNFRGHQYPFKISGLSVLDVGATGTSGTGTVHNLYNIADFNGNYVAVSAGATVVGGGSVTSLRNPSGVVIDAVSPAQGGRLTIGPGGVNITRTGQ